MGRERIMPDVSRLPIAPHIEDEAAAWVARQDTAPLDAQSAAEFERWLRTSPAHAEAFNRYNDLWVELDQLSSRSQRIKERRAANDGSHSFSRRAVAAGLGILLLAGITVGSLRLTGDPQYETAVGEQRAVTLADGSRITLNTDTGLSAHLSETSRHILLERGEALFEVAHDPSRPFIVETPFGNVRAVGTKFVVRIDDGRTLAVLVTEGRVVVSDAKEARVAEAPWPIPLRSGQELAKVKGKSAVANVDTEELSRELAWREGNVVFNGESLADAVAEMQRYTKTKLIVDPSVSRYSVGGYFRTSDVDAFVSTIETVFPVKAERSGDVIKLTARS
jgi:transmembrane sensor